MSFHHNIYQKLFLYVTIQVKLVIHLQVELKTT